MRLKELAYNMWWCWNPEAIDLFRRLDPLVWDLTYHNPVKMLGTISQERLASKAEDDGFLAHLERVCVAFDDYINTGHTWFNKKHGPSEKTMVAYFSAEYGWAESLPLYSGGLGMLAGDHIKSASDLGVPLVGVGLLYRVGYFQQYLNAAGYQQERYPENDFYNMPIELQRLHDGTPLTVEIQLPGRALRVQVWKVQIGRVPVILLDTDTPLNQPQDRHITRELYGGDNETRIQQEIVLGLAGMRALHALNFHPRVYHMNEGHSAFLALERIVIAKERHDMTFAEARELTRSSNVFTTHTPVPAGIDVFPRDLMEKYFTSYFPQLGISWQEFLDLAWQTGTPKGDGFSMAVLALNLSGHANGVSKLHGVVSREMWKGLFAGYPHHEVPIGHITNGVHSRSYISKEMSQLYDRYLGPRWVFEPGDQTIWNRVQDIPSEELWRTHERRRERLVAFARTRLQEQLRARGAPPSEVAQANEVLNPEALTIGFARRFATYKRATLIFQNFERLLKILGDKDRPIQIIVAGKAHPKDEPGKQFIKEIVEFSKDERIRCHLVFIENYDMVVARYLVQGVDVWLNNPRRPQEASGTSGMKASANGAINLSVLDGWWDEAYNPQVGWAIGQGEEYKDTKYQDEMESVNIMELLEKEVVPLFYDRSKDGLPRGWINMMKTSMKQLCPFFNTNRMVADYTDSFYVPGNTRYLDLSSNDRQRAKDLATWMEKIRRAWPGLRIEGVESNGTIEHRVGENVEVKVRLNMNGLIPQDILVQAFLGNVGSDDVIVDGKTFDLSVKDTSGSHCLFVGSLPLKNSGKSGFAIRVIPSHPDLVAPILTHLITWA
jgi:starch phosphorylase